MNKNIRILVVDDFSTMRRIVKNLLSDLGFNNTVEAEDGHSALAVLRQDAVELVVTDWNMPGMTGIELLREIRADAKFRGLPVLMVEQNAKQAMMIADKAYVLVQGANAHTGTGHELMQNDEVRRTFLGG